MKGQLSVWTCELAWVAGGGRVDTVRYQWRDAGLKKAGAKPVIAKAQ